MKIQKFNEKSDGEYEDFSTCYHEFKYLGNKVLLFYDVGAEVTQSIIFKDQENLENYILNYVNEYITHELIEEEDFEEDDMIIDEDDNFIFSNWEKAFDWINNYNGDSEPTLAYLDCYTAENIKISDKVEIALKTKKYNL